MNETSNARKKISSRQTHLRDARNWEKEHLDLIWQGLLRVAPVGIGVASGGLLVEANAALRSMLGLNADDWHGHPLKMFFAKPGAYDWLMLRVRELATTGVPWKSSVQLLTLDGSPIEVELAVTALEEKCAAGRMIFSAQLCSSGLQEVELRRQLLTANRQFGEFSAMFEAIPDAIIIRDFADCIQFWNGGAARLYGWKPAEVLGRTMNALLLAETRVATEALRATQENGRWSGEMRHRNRAGALVTVHSRWTLLRDAQGAATGILISNTDVAELRRPTGQVLRQQRLETIGALARGLAHDFNNILAPVMMSVAMLKEEAMSEDAQSCLTTLGTAAQRGALIANQVLSLARATDSTRVVMNPKHVLTELSRTFRETFPPNIAVKLKFDAEFGMIEADAAQIQQLLTTLCLHARDAMPAGGILSLSASTSQVTEALVRMHPHALIGEHVKISVHHTGKGISSWEIANLFDPLNEANASPMSLPAAMGMAEAHGGFISVESTPETGTSFHVFLPVAKSANGEASAQNTNGAVATPKGHGESVLVVDDEPAVLRIMESVLARYDYRPITAAAGGEAVSVFASRNDIRLVISDLFMPGLDGRATIHQLRQVRPDVRVLAISGQNCGECPENLRSAGAHGFLKKPFTTEELLKAVQAQLTAGNG